MSISTHNICEKKSTLHLVRSMQYLRIISANIEVKILLPKQPYCDEPYKNKRDEYYPPKVEVLNTNWDNP